ncbi:hypothetical protein E2I00_013689 [Balaenoptera physalus]|uniref:Calreticulin n=1 Tax=Balaenoptera physalus TaxID=9770 RepID=A0A643CE60_BALPH|nr:hypothetical protein E2I00_013689 [Balaenoptera physalus]
MKTKWPYQLGKEVMQRLGTCLGQEGKVAELYPAIPRNTDSKPEDWDKPEHIPDPDAKKPEDWDEETDGEWEPTVIQNPEHKGEWKPRQTDNPDYKGIWIHPEIDNPEYSPDSNIYAYENFAVLGLDLWQVKSGTIFDNFLITNNEAYAEEFGSETWGVTKAAEKQMKDKQDEEQRLKEEEEKKRKEDEEDEDDDEEDEAEKVEEEEEDAAAGQAKDELQGPQHRLQGWTEA